MAETLSNDKLPPDRVLFFQGAESRIYRINYEGADAIEKLRFEKAYRHPALDAQIRRHRTKTEAKVLQLLEKQGINAPKLLQQRDFSIVMQLVQGCTLTSLYMSGRLTDSELLQSGRLVKQLHTAQVTHNDLTTSNFILAEDGRLFVIDFGLAQIGNCTYETRSVDLYVLERALLALTGDPALFGKVLDGYGLASEPAMVQRLEEVRKRGRKR